MANQFTNITLGAPTTTTITIYPCILSGIVINKAAASAVIAIYNGATVASGTLIGTITMPGTLLESQKALDYKDIDCDKGLTIVTTTAQDITVIHRPR
jgi:hypothetical protein